jgi:hypothetical protein
MPDEEMKAELERLRSENAALKKGATSGIRMKVSEKGAVSVYGMGRWGIACRRGQCRESVLPARPDQKNLRQLGLTEEQLRDIGSSNATRLISTLKG